MNAFPPLTLEEQAFAAKHYALVSRYLRMRRMSPDEYHDAVILHYLKAVRSWLADDSLHEYSFVTIAYNAMRSGLSQHFRRECTRNRIAPTVSMDAVIPGTEDLTLGDTIADPADGIKDAEDRALVEELLELVHPARRRQILMEVM